MHQVFLQQSVTLLALKDKTINNGTVAPDLVHPKLFFGIVNEDIPLFIGAVIGASLIIALTLVILTLWKCCCRMTILSKKKEYWLEPKESYKGKHKVPVVQSNSVVFLGLKPTHIFDCKRERSSEDCRISHPFSPFKEQTLKKKPLSRSQHIKMLSQNSDPTASESEQGIFHESRCLPATCSENDPKQTCSVISVPPVLNKTIVSHVTKPPNDVCIPNVIIHQDSPGFFHRSFYSGTFDQHSLFSCDSHVESEFDFKRCSLTWSNYSLRPASTSDCYYDLFQKASICKKRKNRMRSDIAAAIALNRSQSSQLNKDTELLVENEVEVVLDERTTL